MKQGLRLIILAAGMGCLAAGGADLDRLTPSRSMVWLDFESPAVPKNGDGDTLPAAYTPVCDFTTAIASTGSISGSCLSIKLTRGPLYAQFNPWNYAGRPDFPEGPRAFARDYCKKPEEWKFNTYNRLRFWMKAPLSHPQLPKDGTHLIDVGTYVKRVENPDRRSDETGNAHYYHFFDLPPTDTWTQVILNMHPNHRRGDPGGKEPGDLPHPTGEAQYNYFDTLTRVYLDASYRPPTVYPTEYLLDEMVFYREPFPENDEQVYTVVSTYVPSGNLIILRWNRNKNEDRVAHEVRYAFSNIHKIGWSAATKAPGGRVVPPGSGGYNGMVYESSALPLAGHKEVYLAIKPERSSLFTQVRVPLNLP